MIYDIAIIGSGLVGASLGAALSCQDFRIAMIDKAPPPDLPDAEFSARAIALSAISLKYLETLEILPKLKPYLDPIHSVWVSEQGRFGITRITAGEYGLSALGAVIEADRLNYLLNQTLEDAENISLFRATKIKTLSREEGIWRITLADGSVLKSNLIVGADGSDSLVRISQGVGVSCKVYPAMAIVVNVALARSHQQRAFERFTETGSLAMLPFGENRVKCIWILPPKEAQSLSALSEEAFLQALQFHFGHRLGKMVRIGKRLLVPLKQSLADHLYGLGWVLIGNAAQTLHPIAAQGFNLGLRDVAWLSEQLIDQKRKGGSLQAISCLKNYASKRLGDQASVRKLSDQLIEGSWQRRLGVLSSEWFPPLHRWVTRSGIGLQDELPKSMWPALKRQDCRFRRLVHEE